MNARIEQEIKSNIAQRFDTDVRNITFAKVSTNGYWNFDVKKEKFVRSVFFAFYDEVSGEYAVAHVPADSLDVRHFPEKDLETIRFFVDAEYKDRSGFSFRNLLQ